jgi:hypothetical protein
MSDGDIAQKDSASKGLERSHSDVLIERPSNEAPAGFCERSVTAA